MKKTKHSIHFIHAGHAIKKTEKLGIYARRINELASLNLPILESVVLDFDILKTECKDDVYELINPYIKTFSKNLNSNDNNLPPLFRVIPSLDLAISKYPSAMNLGLTNKTIIDIEKAYGEDVAKILLLDLLQSIYEIYKKMSEIKKENDMMTSKILCMQNVLNNLKNNSINSIIKEFAKYTPKGFFESVKIQLNTSTTLLLGLSQLEDEDIAIIVQPILYPKELFKEKKDFFAGFFYSRNIITGEKKIIGNLYENAFCKTNKDLLSLPSKYLTKFSQIGRDLEDIKKEITKIDFTIHNDAIYILDAKASKKHTARAKLQCLLDMHHRSLISKEELINKISVEEANSLLYPTINVANIKKENISTGGIVGAMGVAKGNVYFSSASLLEVKKKNKDAMCILVIEKTMQDDVSAIEMSEGVLSKDGNYSSHASVVARQYGKTSIIRSDMQLLERRAIIEGHIINEGDEITLQAPLYDIPTIYFGNKELVFSSPKENGLSKLIEIASTFIKKFYVRANADSENEVKLAIEMGALGIGLCRTEHMFFSGERLNILRELLITKNEDDKQELLLSLKKMQKDDFYAILRASNGRPITIRLLDALVHEVLSSDEHSIDSFMVYLEKKKKPYTKNEVLSSISMLSQTNPMLGCRGCRIGITKPEIYKMQLEAIFEAAYSQTKVIPNIEIMIPLVMSFRELRQIAFGKRIEGGEYIGISEIEESVHCKFGGDPIKYKIGAMIELPASALGAGEIARYAQFLSFGTNDLTQTTLGLSRDDSASFLSHYFAYDILNENPFIILDERVKELMYNAIMRARLTRSDLKIGFCGEHAIHPTNIKSFMEMGGDYISCSPYAIPQAILTIAKLEIGY